MRAKDSAGSMEGCVGLRGGTLERVGQTGLATGCCTPLLAGCATS